MTYSRGPGTCVDPGPGTLGPTGQYSQYADALKAVKDEWAAEGLTVRIMGPHVDSIVRTGGVTNPSRLNHQMEFIKAVKNHADPALIDFVDVYNSNGYLDPFYDQEDAAKTWAAYWNGKAAVPGNWPAAFELPGVKDDGKPVYMSETGEAAAAWLNGSGGTPGDGAITVAQRIFTAVVHGNVSTYVYWRLADASTTEGREELVGSSKLADPETSKKYSAFKHFSRYVRPGAQRVGATFDSNGFASVGGASEYDTYNSLSVAAFLHQEDATLTYVLINMLPSTESVIIKLPVGLTVSQFDRYDTDQSVSFQNSGSLAVANDQVSLSMTGYSVTTLTGAVIPSVPLAPILLGTSLGLTGAFAVGRLHRETGGQCLIKAGG